MASTSRLEQLRSQYITRYHEASNNDSFSQLQTNDKWFEEQIKLLFLEVYREARDKSRNEYELDKSMHELVEAL